MVCKAAVCAINLQDQALICKTRIYMSHSGCIITRYRFLCGLQAIQDIVQPLGLFRKRAAAIRRFSAEYLQHPWTCPTQLYGVGKYGSDAYWMFCRGRWREISPEDKVNWRFTLFSG